MTLAIQYALSGLNSASRQFESAARDITGNPEVNETFTAIAENSGNTDISSNSNGQGIPSSPLASDVTAISEEAPSLAEGLVSLKEAEVSYKANATVISALQETEERVLEILA